MIQTIGIVGAGQMGNGIAHVLAVAGYDILLTDTSTELRTPSGGDPRRGLLFLACEAGRRGANIFPAVAAVSG